MRDKNKIVKDNLVFQAWKVGKKSKRLANGQKMAKIVFNVC